jgi:hypothetical protein
VLLDLFPGVQRCAGRLVAYAIALYAIAAGYVVALRYPFGGDEEATVGQRAMPVPPVKSGLPQPDWDSGDVFMTPPPGVGYSVRVAMAHLEPQPQLDEPAGGCQVGRRKQPGSNGVELNDRDALCAHRSEQGDVSVDSG